MCVSPPQEDSGGVVLVVQVAVGTGERKGEGQHNRGGACNREIEFAGSGYADTERPVGRWTPG